MADFDSLMITLGLDAAAFRQAVQQVTNDLKKVDNAARQTGSEITRMGSRWGDTLSGIVKSFAGPLLAAASFSSMMASYTSDVAKVAKEQGVYNEKLEEERKKKALLQRVTKEDLELYKKSREALSKFDIATSNLSATFMRTFAPAMEFAVNMVSKLSDWIDRNQGNITRFLLIVAGIVSTALIPAFARWAATMLANPITWIILAIGALALIIDDLVTYIQGGESAFADFWSQFGTGQEISEKLAKAWEWLKNVFAENREGLVKLGAIILAHVVAIKAIMAVAGPAGKAVAMFGSAFKALGFVGPLLKGIVVGIRTVTMAVVSNPIGAAIALAIAAIVLLIANWDKVKEVATQVANTVKATWADVQNWFLGLGNSLGEIWETLQTKFFSVIDTIKGYFTGFINDIKANWEGFTEWFVSIGDSLGEVWESLKTSFQNVLNTIKGWFTEFIDYITSKIQSLLSIGDSISKGWDSLKGALGFGGDTPSQDQTQAAIPPSATATTNNDTTITNTATVGSITINAANGDPNTMAQGIGPAIQRSAPGWVNAQNGVF